jgi:predicted phosphodiesterase
MTKLLIIPDVHGRVFWKEATEKYDQECDKIIFLGDYVDSYPYENITKKQTINNFEEIIAYKINNKDKVVLLLGNHDMQYFSKEFHTRSRYDSSNAWHIANDFKTHRSLFKLAHEEDINGKKFLFSHSGLMNSWIKRNENVIGDITVASINHLLEIPLGIRILTDVSSYRSWFGEKSGSIVWSDVREKIDMDASDEDNIISNTDAIVEGYDYQIFGHTQQNEKPIITDNWACLDCRKAFILNDDGVLTQIDNEAQNTDIHETE